MSAVAAIVLAAGSSSRLGTPKQTLEFQGQTLLRRAALTAVDAGCSPVIVVTGANADLSRPELEGLNVQEVFNPNWETGIGSSISAGVHDLLRDAPSADAVILMLCDQPHVTAEVITALITAFRTTQKAVIASTYGGTTGVPALFTKPLFQDLTQLEGGAKQLIEKYASEAHLLPFEGGDQDIDTTEDYSRLLRD